MTSSPRLHRPDPAGFRRAVVHWARTVDRPLPWRGEKDPYRVLVSEVMLQQTQAARVVPSYQRFLVRFPDVQSLASATTADVLREWGTLGYNRRALNLRRAAAAVAERGGFPRTVDELRTLPGVGSYTSRAVASFAFNAQCGVVDANVRRVLSRAFAKDGNVQDLADDLTPRGRSATWNQAMIDLGATVCTARKPRCGECPVRANCRWAAEARPPAAKRTSAPRFETTSRFVRGRIVSELRAGPSSVTSLERRVGVERDRFRDALDTLQRDGLVCRTGARVALGDG